MPYSFKRGRLSKEEMAYIANNAQSVPPGEIARQLNRSEDTVTAYIIQELGIIPQGHEDSPVIREMREELRSTMEWRCLQDEFSPEELNFFEHRYAKIMAQFRGDTTETEKTQIHTLIKYEILLHRNLSEQRKSEATIDKIDKALQNTYEKYEDISEMPDSEKNWCTNQENILAGLRAGSKSTAGEFMKLTEREAATLKELKATRDQRVSKKDNAKESFIGLIKSLQEADIRDKEGRHMEIARLATDKEMERLSQFHEYGDKTVDQPLLTPETVRTE
jgi:hypothetical protein